MTVINGRVEHPYGGRDLVDGVLRLTRPGLVVDGQVVVIGGTTSTSITAGVVAPVNVDPGVWSLAILPERGRSHQVTVTVPDMESVSVADLVAAPPDPPPPGAYTYRDLATRTYLELGG